MRVVFNCNTYYQLIVAIQLKLTTFKEDEVILLFSDLSNGADEVVRRIRDIHLFTEAYLIEKYERIRKKKGSLDRIKELGRLIFGTKKCDFGKVDLLMYYNVDEFYVYELFSTIKKKNKKLKCRTFEENYFSYNMKQTIPYPSIKLSNRIRNITGMTTLKDATEAFYCFKPKGYLGNLKTELIPSFDSDLDEIKQVLRIVFNIRPNKLEYSKKYIYFTSVYDFEGGDAVGEFELVCKVADFVGKDNILVKVHPRDRRNVYVENGFNVDTNSYIPWEAIQLNYDFSNHVFLSLNSGCALLVTTNMSCKLNVGYLYECIDVKKNKLAQESKVSAQKLFDVMKGENGFEKIYVLKNVEDILKL